ncbi:MAG: NAD(P)-dependent oxidoreductase [Lachnospiraceae bacterium]|nr:NAD(P)-dependent oxidoreductase [Lachnospiraceae bacterium]
MIKVLISGDSFFDPDIYKERLKEAFPEGTLDIRTHKYVFTCPGYLLEENISIPSGMVMEDPAVKASYPDCGVNEFYGEPYMLFDEIKDAEVLFIHGAALPRKVIENADNLKCIISMRGGPVNIDRQCLKERNIEFYNTNGKNAQAVAEFALGATLAFERGMAYGNACLMENWWWIKAADKYKSHELQNKTFGLIGYGRVARCLRKLLTGFDAKVIAYDPYVGDEAFAAENVKKVSLDELVSTADYVSLHARAEKGEPPVMNKEKIAMMKPSAVLINSARGALLDYKALKSALHENKIRGAVIDVLGSEPFGFYEDIIKSRTAFITPHIAGSTVETVNRGYSMGIDLLKKYISEK